jgi:hypothetical protein
MDKFLSVNGQNDIELRSKLLSHGVSEKDIDRIEQAISEYEQESEKSEFAERAVNFGFVTVLMADKYGKDMQLKDSDPEWQDWLSLKSWTPLEFVLLLCEVSPIRVSKNESDSDIIKNLPDYMAMLYRKAEEEGPTSPDQWKRFAEAQGIYLPKPILDISKDASRTSGGKKADHEEPKSDKPRLIRNPKDPQPEQPWLIHNPKDPEPEQLWYIPARYFARERVKKDPTLIFKRDLLAAKVVESLSDVGIFKRGGKLPFNPATVLKAFSNVSFD